MKRIFYPVAKELLVTMRKKEFLENINGILSLGWHITDQTISRVKRMEIHSLAQTEGVEILRVVERN